MPAARYPRMERPKKRTSRPNERAPPDDRAITSNYELFNCAMHTKNMLALPFRSDDNYCMASSGRDRGTELLGSPSLVVERHPSPPQGNLSALACWALSSHRDWNSYFPPTCHPQAPPRLLPRCIARFSTNTTLARCPGEMCKCTAEYLAWGFDPTYPKLRVARQQSSNCRASKTRHHGVEH